MSSQNDGTRIASSTPTRSAFWRAAVCAALRAGPGAPSRRPRRAPPARGPENAPPPAVPERERRGERDDDELAGRHAAGRDADRDAATRLEPAGRDRRAGRHREPAPAPGPG